MQKGLALLVALILLMGCLGQSPAPAQTETPSPTQTPSPTPFDSSAQITELNNYGLSLGLSQEVIAIIQPSYSFSLITSDEYKNTIKDVMLELSKVPEKYESFKFRVGAANIVMENGTINADDKKTVADYGNLVNLNVTQMNELKKEDFTLEDGKQTDLEKSYLANATNAKFAIDLKNYYLEEIEKIYPELADELKELPELSTSRIEKQNLETLEDIYGLLLITKSKNKNSNEIMQSFKEMVTVGTPNPQDFKYTVPIYNVALQNLLWLGESNEIDTLSIPIALNYSYWNVVGDNQVKDAVKKDSNDLLNYFRETNMMQLERGYPLLYDLSFYAKCILMNMSGQDSPGTYLSHTFGKYRNPFFDHLEKQMNLADYRWAIIEISTLKNARNLAEKEGLTNQNVNIFARNLEDRFDLNKSHWEFTHRNPQKITFEGETFLNSNFNNPDFEFKYYTKNGKGVGACADQVGLLNVFMKSWGIPSFDYAGITVKDNKDVGGDAVLVYYNPQFKLYYAADNSRIKEIHMGSSYNVFYFLRPPTQLSMIGKYKNNITEKTKVISGPCPQFNMFFLPYDNSTKVGNLLLSGIPESIVYQWLFSP